MSAANTATTTTSIDPATAIDPQAGLMLSVAEHIILLFQVSGIDVPTARRMAVSALYAYEPETRADFVNAARTIAFSMASLALLGRAVSGDMPMTEQMRAYGRANGLNRSADQSERAMMQRRRYQLAHAPAEQTEQKIAAPMPEQDVPEIELDTFVGAAMAEYLAARGTEATVAEPAPATVRAPSVPQASSPVSAIQYRKPASGIGQARPPGYKEELLRHSAMVSGAAPPPMYAGLAPSFI